jgi:glutamate 5-kinase
LDRKELLKSVRRIVVKIGTAALSAPEGGLDESRVAALAEQVHALKQRGMQVAVVSSGAIGAGMNALKMRKRPTQLPELQACAAIGQGHLTAVYDQSFRKHGYHAAQMLLTRDDFNDRHRYLNASNALHAILKVGAVPVINENDTISVEELALSFGDNDGLAALVAHLLSADMLIILTTVDGLYEDPEAPAARRKVISEVSQVNEEVLKLANGAVSRGGRGGMTSKLEAARIVAEAGGSTLIANARTPRVLERVLDGDEVGTIFLPAGKERMASRKRWLRFGGRPKGTIAVDDGAQRALVVGNKSLLPSGIVAVTGDFARGDLVAVCDTDGEEFARGLVNYNASEMRLILGKKSSTIRGILGECPYDEAIHRDHLVLNTQG